jgi:tetratricopeptide (TPR) repeat protein
MRLLHFDTLERLVLTDFRGKTIPPYAILSHRWSDSEILSEHISNGVYKEREEGYRKLEFCAKQAAHDKLQYFWIDTCCIDRWNKSERSEAINSMFQWYKDATRCYVFLSDVTASTATEPLQRSDWEASFRSSAWFTRGWTLQELIAPVSVDFFSCSGHGLGDKASLDQLLHDITSIPLAALRNCPLDQFSTSERRRWADNRVTTEAEDTVYCLLGLLGVAMSTTYGEGSENALRRLQAEVEAAGSTPSLIPFLRNESFVGRESQLAEVEAKLFSNGWASSTLLAIVGRGGTGKSQLALEVAHRTRQNNKNCSVFWIDASDKDSLYQSYAGIAQKLNMLGGNNDLADMKLVVKRCVAEMSARQCLLVFDSADTILVEWSSRSSLAGTTGLLAECLPESKLCSAIFTTTQFETGPALAIENIIELQDLTADSALRLLQNHLIRPLSDAEQHEAKYLVRELSYLPIAVVQAAACINASNMTLHQYQEQLEMLQTISCWYSSDSSESGPWSSSVTNAVAITLSVSMEQIAHSNACAIDYLSLTACVDRKDISLDLLEATSPRIREDAIKVLDKYALVTRRPADSALDVHRRVHHVLRQRLQAQGRLELWTRQAIKQLLRVFPADDHRNRSKWRRLLPHAQFVLSHSPTTDDNEERLDLAWRCAAALYSDGRYNEAEELQVQVMQSKTRLFGNDHASTLTSMANLATTYCNQGRWEEAEELQIQVLQTRKRVLNDEHPSVLSSMSNLASMYRNQGRWKEAEDLQVQATQMMKKVLGDEHLNTLTSMANLVATYGKQGRWNEAEELQTQVLQTRRRILGDEHPDTLSSIANLTIIYRNQGRWKEAADLQTEVLDTTKKVLGNEHPDTLGRMHNLAFSLHSQDRFHDAIALMETCALLRQKVLGDNHPRTQSSFNALNGWRSELEQD